MKQEDWDAGIVQARAKLGRLMEQAEAMTDDEYKAFKIAEMERQRPLQIEHIRDMARKPFADYATKHGITEEMAASALQKYRDTTPGLFFERLLQALQDTPAAQMKARDMRQLSRIVSGLDTAPVPEDLG